MRWCSQMLPPPQSLHLLLSRWCSQMLPPSHSLHRLRMRWCSQKADPPHSLHSRRFRWCGHSFLCLRAASILCQSTASVLFSPRPLATSRVTVASRLFRLQITFCLHRVVSRESCRDKIKEIKFEAAAGTGRTPQAAANMNNRKKANRRAEKLASVPQL